jgi:hypothetical protein
MHRPIATLALLTLIATGCKEKAAPTPAPKPAQPAANPTTPGHSDHGGMIELGSTTIGPYTVRASRDAGDIKPGGDAPIDVWVTGDSPKVTAVRFWIGTQDGAGSVKAKADIEDPKEPNHWHTHAEVPEPLPAGSKLWVEIEDDKGVKTTGSYDLKA